VLYYALFRVKKMAYPYWQGGKKTKKVFFMLILCPNTKVLANCTPYIEETTSVYGIGREIMKKVVYLLFITGLAISGLLLAGCSSSGNGGTTPGQQGTSGQVAAPQFSPAGSTYVAAQSVTISCATSNTVIFYTTDGSDPRVSGNLYTGPISFSSNTTIRAIAYDYKTDLKESDVADATYRFIPGAPTVTVSATADNYNKATVTWGSATNAASFNIYYAQGTAVTTSSGTKIENVTSPYTISNLSTDKYYAFIVTAVNSNGEGAASAVATAKIQGHWEVLGSAGFSDGESKYTEIAVAPDGTPYVVYKDNANSEKVTVKKYNTSTGWVTVGSAGFSAGNIISPCISIDSNNVPYVAYINSSSAYVTVMKYNSASSAWEPVGSDINGIPTMVYESTGDGLGSLSLAIAPDNTPYIAFADSSKSNKATVMKLNGSAWEPVGTVGFSAHEAVYISLAISNDGTPYVAYNDLETIWNYRVTVKKYIPSDWTDVQSFGIPVTVKIMTDSAGVPYVGYVYGIAPDRFPKMVKYKTIEGFTNFRGLPADGLDWTVYSSTPFYYSIAIDANDTAYAAFDHGKALVRRFNAVSDAWESVGLEDFSAGNIAYISIAIDKSTNTPYVAFQDITTGKATVMVYK
jgi:hypothetical protein